MDITVSVEQLAADLKAAQDSLRNIHAILRAIAPGTTRDAIYYEIGRAQGEAWVGLNHSGADNLPSLAGDK